MFFFINNTVQQRVTGIESAQYKRLRMLKHYQVPAKIMTISYNPQHVKNMVTYHLAPDDVLDMYDYLCDVPTTLPIQPLTVGSFSQPNLTIEGRHGDTLHFTLQKQLIKKMFADEKGNVSRIDYFGATEDLVRTEIYDSRGFKSSVVFFDADQKPSQECYYSPTGTLKIRVTYEHDHRRDTKKIAAIMYYATDGRQFYFEQEEELQSYFFDRVNADYPSASIFVADRTQAIAWGLTHMRTPAYKLFHVHSTHVNLLQYPLSDDFNANYQFALQNLDLWNGMIVSTNAQAAHLRQKFPAANVFCASVSIIDDELLNRPVVPRARRVPNKVIVAARIDDSKRLQEAILTIALVKKKIPTVTLDFWGMVVNAKLQENLEALVKKLDLEQTVSFKGYTTEMASVYDSAQVSMMTSRYEGTGLVIAESLVYGVPVVAYDFSYGPREFIEDGVNGFIVPVDDRVKAAERVTELLQNGPLWQEMSTAAHAHSQHSAEKNIIGSWQAMERAAQEFYRSQEEK